MVIVVKEINKEPQWLEYQSIKIKWLLLTFCVQRKKCKLNKWIIFFIITSKISLTTYRIIKNYFKQNSMKLFKNTFI